MANTVPLLVNAASSTIAAGGGTADGTGTAITLTDASRFPSPDNSKGEYVPLSITDTTTAPWTTKEIVYATAKAGNVLTIVRGAEDSASFVPAALTAGMLVEVTYTTASVKQLVANAAAGASSPGAGMYPSANVSVPNGAWTAIPFDSERWSVGGAHSTVTNNTRFTIPVGGAGKYLFSGVVDFAAATATNFRGTAILKNGATYNYFSYEGVPTTGEFQRGGALVLDCAEGDYFELVAYQNSGVALNVLGGAGNATRLDVVKLTPSGGCTTLLGTFRGARVYISANQSIPSAGAIVTWDSETYDTDGFHSTASNTSRLTIPAGMGGKYLVTAFLEFVSNATGARQIGIYRNGTVVAWGDLDAGNATAGPGCSVTTILDLAAGDYVEVFAFQNSGAAVNIQAVGAGVDSRFELAYLGGGGVGSVKSCSVWLNAAGTSLPNATRTAIPFDSEHWDTDNFHDTASNNTRITIPAGGDGKYLFSGAVDFGNNVNGGRQVMLYKNGALHRYFVYAVDSTQGETIYGGSCLVDAVAGDYFELIANQTSGGALAVNTGTHETYFSCVQQGSALSTPATLVAPSPSQVPLIVKAAAGQTANLQEWQNSTGTVLSKVNSSGRVATPVALVGTADVQAAIGNGQVRVIPEATTEIGVVVRALASHTADLIQLQDSTGARLAGWEKDGQLTAPYVAAYAPSSSARPLTVKTAAAPSANATEWQDSAGTPAAFMSGNGSLFLRSSAAFNNNAGVVPALGVQAAIATMTPLVVKAAASQSGNLTEWQNSSGAVLAYVSKSGHLFVDPGSSTTQSVGFFRAGNAGAVVLECRGAASQSADLQQWENSSGTVVAGVRPAGGLYLAPAQLSYSSVGAWFSVQQSGGALGQIIKAEGGSNTQRLLQAQSSAAAEIAYISSSGNVAGTGAYTTLSDALTKRNVRPLPGGALERVLGLKPVKYDYIGGDIDQVGFVAQDVIGVIPEAVVPFDATRMGTRSEVILATLVQAVQEIVARTPALR